MSESSLDPFAASALLLVACIAAITDARSGRIPNWLTLPVAAAAPPVLGAAAGWSGLLTGVAGLVVSASVPWLLYRATAGRAIGGGDVKLFTALGAIAGPSLGLQIQLNSFVVLAVFALARLTYQGQLLRVLGNSAQLLFSPILPRRWRRAIEPASLMELRLGPFVAFATFAVVAAHLFSVWIPWLRVL